MDDERFDRLTRTFPRRTATRGLVAGLLATIFSSDVGAGRSCPNGTNRCRGACIPKRRCCTDANCKSRGSGQICTRGRCQCPRTKKRCGKDCIPERTCCRARGECCDNSDCPTGTREVCRGLHCSCPPGESKSGGACGEPPTCNGSDDFCDGLSQTDCCSFVCRTEISQCAESGEFMPCHDLDDCEAPYVCRAFICVTTDFVFPPR